MSRKGFGPRAQAMVSLLTSKYRLSKRLVQAWFSDVYQMPICLGSVSNVEHRVSQSLEQIHKDITPKFRAQWLFIMSLQLIIMLSEQRPLIISKKLTFGTQSERGSRFIERLFSVVATCKQQKKEILAFIIEALLQWVSTQKNLDASFQRA